MSSFAAIRRTSFVIALAGVLLAASVPCTSVCSALMSSGEIASAEAGPESHCAKREAAANASPVRAPSERPRCDDTCAGCSADQISIPSSTASIDLVSNHGLLAVASRPFFQNANRRTPVTKPQRSSQHPPPGDVLARTTTLLI